MVMQRYDPFRNALGLRAMMDRFFDDRFLRPFGAQGADDALPLDISETNDAYVVRASMPGVRPDAVQITAQGNTVTIKGEMEQEQEQRDGDYLIRERRVGVYQRTFTLPMAVDVDKAEARFEDGVLTLTLPKHEGARPRRISVRNQGASDRRQQQGDRQQQTDSQRQQLSDRQQQTDTQRQTDHAQQADMQQANRSQQMNASQQPADRQQQTPAAASGTQPH